MSVEDDTLTGDAQRLEPVAVPDAGRRLHRPHGPRFLRRRPRTRPRIRKLRFVLFVVSFVALATVSGLFGMLTSIASDLPQLVPKAPSASVDSYLYDVTGQPIGVLAPPNQKVLVGWTQISQNMVHAIVAVEDKRYWTDPGIDVKGLVRALFSDVTGGQYEGGSTIPEEFVKVSEQEEGHRTVFEKLREAGLAFQLVHKWPRDRILTDYLNTIYFGNGANGVEAAARVYFGWNHGYIPGSPATEKSVGCGSPDAEDRARKECADVLYPWESALLAAMVANPTEFDPVGTQQERFAAFTRRNLVLRDMYQQHYISHAMYKESINKPLPTPAEIQQPQEPSTAPYFTSWVRPLIIRALQNDGLTLGQAENEAYYGGLQIHLSVNLQLQSAAQKVVDDEFPSGKDSPTASLVAIDNKTGEVRAMVSGNGDYNQSPFNLATLGYRQPGSSFKLFTLAAALSSGKYGPDSEFDSKPITISFVKQGNNAYAAANGTGRFQVHNFNNTYSGLESLSTATAISDNSVFAQVGLSLGTARIKSYAEAMGIRSPISTNPSMVLGGLSTGVSALDMAHAYETVATGGYKIWNKVLGDVNEGPIGIASIKDCGECTTKNLVNARDGFKKTPELSPEVAETIDSLLHGPVDDPFGTGTAAAIPGVDVAGKTGTTSNYVDAWFVGWTPQMTVAVWVGYPNSGKPMLTNFGGKPVEGGTYPAIIWHNFMVNALQILADQAAAKQHQKDPNLGLQSISTTPAQTSSTSTNGTSSTTQTTGGGSSGNPGKGKGTSAGTQPTGPSNQGSGGTQSPTTTPVVTTPSTTAAPTTTPDTTTAPAGSSGGTGL